MMTVTKNPSSILAVELSNGEHRVVSDVAKALGGEDLGLNPHELLEASLGACTTLTLELYAKRKNWDVSEMVVEVKIVKEGKETVIERKITFGPNQTAEAKQRLTEIANKCPIHSLLASSIKVETQSF